MNIAINVTRECNLNCRHCYLKKKDAKIDAKLMDSFAGLMPDSITLTGGEPFKHPDLYAIIDKALGYTSHVHLLTNGILVKEEDIEKLIERNVELFLTEQIKDDEWLDKFRKAKERGMNISFHILYDEETRDNLDDVLERYSFGDHLLFLFPTEISKDYKSPSAPEWENRIALLHQKAGELRKKISYEPAFIKVGAVSDAHLKEMLCPTGKDIFIDADKKAYACCLGVDIINGTDEIKSLNIKGSKDGCYILKKIHGKDPRHYEGYVPICPLVFTDLDNSFYTFPSELKDEDNKFD